VPWQLAAQATGATLRYLHVQEDATLSLDELDTELARGSIRLVAVAHISNVLGTLNPVKEITERAHAAGALVLVDGSQAVPQLPVDIAVIGCDFYAWTGHKALGPTGIGVLHARRELLEEMPPFLGGGSMIATVSEQESTWAMVPQKFEAGTPPIAEAAGLDAALQYLAEIGMDTVRAHEAELTAYALERLPEVAGISIFGTPDIDKRGGAVSFAIDGIHPHDVAELCGRENVCIRAGHHCAQPLMRHLGVAATARASFHVYNNREDVDRLVEALQTARKVFEL
jgi:cysteine desulfurase/selenocysteine lyase